MRCTLLIALVAEGCDSQLGCIVHVHAATGRHNFPTSAPLSMRILDIISSVNPTGGGPIEGLKQQAEVLSKRGNTIEVASLDDPSAPWVRDFPMKLYPLGPSRFPFEWLNYAYAPRFIPWLHAHAQNYDAVIVHGLWQYHGFATWRVLRDGPIPYYVFTHGMLDPWFKRAYPLKHMKKWLYWPWAEYRVLRDAKAVLFTCEEERVLARRSFWLYRCREMVVGFGTAAVAGNADLQREIFFQEFPGLRDKRLLLFLSRIHPKKGCDLLIEAFARVAKRDPALHLVMAGPDQLGWKEKLEAQAEALSIADRITWAGMLSGDLKWGAYRVAEVFMLPSHQENFGIVVAEALACGVPVLISDKVNIWREIRSAGAGLVAEDNLEGTLSLLQTWLDISDQKRQQMRRDAQVCFESNFEMSAAAGRLHNLLSTA